MKELKWFIFVPIVLIASWLAGILDPPSGFDAYRKAERYLKGRAPFGTEFLSDFGRELPFSEEPSGDVYCHFRFRLPGATNTIHKMVVVKRSGRFLTVRE